MVVDDPAGQQVGIDCNHTRILETTLLAKVYSELHKCRIFILSGPSMIGQKVLYYDYVHFTLYEHSCQRVYILIHILSFP